jgi:hypothetical protein
MTYEHALAFGEYSGSATPQYILAAKIRELERENNRMRWLLRQIVTDLPLGRRDWLNPDYEREMRALANASGQTRPAEPL